MTSVLAMSTDTPTAPSPSLIGVSHEDGDIVLAAGESVDHVEEEFRVHRSIICLHSPVLRDLVKNSQPDELKDGCPVVRCYDSVSDVRAWLSALYNGLYVNLDLVFTNGILLMVDGIRLRSGMHQDNQLTLDVALSILLLSDKYESEGLRRGIIRILQEDWPPKYSDYLARQTFLGSPGCRVLESLKIIKIASRCGAPSLLPAAIYEVVASRTSEWSDVERAAFDNQSSTDLSRLFIGRSRSAERLRALVTWSGVAFFIAWTSDVDAALRASFTTRKTTLPCAHKDTRTSGVYYCSSLFDILRTKIGERLFPGEFGLSALRKLQRTDFHGDGRHPCENCKTWFMTVLAEKELEIWENIPVDFDLPNIDPKLYSETMFKRLIW